MSIYIGRQPIFNKHGDCFGYELLYRSCNVNNEASFLNNAQATTQVIMNIIHNLGLHSVLGDKLGFINIDETIIFNDILLLLPKDNFIFEILEHTKLSPEFYERIKMLKELGYHFSLDDFDCSDAMMSAYEPLFEYVDFIKIDIQAIGCECLKGAIAKLASYNIPLLAEKIETIEEFHACMELHFDYYQGYFFERPIILTGKKIEPNVSSAIRLINCIQHNDDPEFISKQFQTCPDLLFNLLKHINSGAYHFKHKINSIKQIILLLGPQKLRSWLGLFIYVSPENRPFGREMFNSAKFRAKLMEELAIKCHKKHLVDKAFLTGSLSLIDAYLNIPMQDFLAECHLDEDIEHALLHQAGPLGELLKVAIEMNHASDIHNTVVELHHCTELTSEQFYDAYAKAMFFLEQTQEEHHHNV